MASNFAFLEGNRNFESFSGACVEAEKGISSTPATCAILTRRALELAVKWVYSFDGALTVPYQDNLSSLIHAPDFLSLIAPDLLPRLKYIVRLGNAAVHTNMNITRGEAVVSLKNLHEFVSWIDYCYADEYTAGKFDESCLLQGEDKRTSPDELQKLYEKLSGRDKKLEELIKQNQELRKLLTGKREQNTRSSTFKVEEISEYETRKRYIDLDLKTEGWDFSRDIEEELEVYGMPNGQGVGYVDYVLFGENGKPLGIVEAKRTSIDPKQGKQQAKLYADCIEKKFGQRPVIFYTNGFETYIWDDLEYPERRVSGFYTKEELSLLIDRRTMKLPLDDIEINESITNRHYQKQAIMAVCGAIKDKQRKALLVMATGSGKTRAAISIVDVLTRANYIKNVLFLTDRITLVRQAKNNFTKFLPNLSLCNLLESKEDPEQCRMIFSTYPTMMNAIDDAKRKDGGKLFTPGHFDLIIIDESHRSIYRKYGSIFDYFDGILLGLTATPKDDIDKNTYEVFDLETHVPTFAYELDQAVADGYLLDYRTVETQFRLPVKGIKYDELSDEEKEMYEETFDDEVGDEIPGDAINNWLINDDTIDKVLKIVMEKGIKVEGGDKLGKTIIFANNHNHALEIEKRFNILYPEYGGEFARVIDYSVNYSQSLIDSFSGRNRMPQIAISVDMLDTGVDIHEIVNLVFFKKVYSKSKFWQMIGRGTRLCEDLFGPGMDKKNFLIFDFCGNFEFFRVNPKGIEGKLTESLTERIFNIKVGLIKKLQDINVQEEYAGYRRALVDEALSDINGLIKENFRVKRQLRYVHKFKNRDAWQALQILDVEEIKEHISPILIPVGNDEFAKRFDYLMYVIELAGLQSCSAAKSIKRVVKTAEQLSKLGTIPQVVEKRDTINRAMSPEFWKSAGLLDIDRVRRELRDLIKFLEKDDTRIYYANFTDEVMGTTVDGPQVHESYDLTSYKKKVTQYLDEHKDDLAIYKLRNNKRLTEQDFQTLERILWRDLGTREDYRKEYGDTPITRLVRQIVGLDPKAANEAFSEFLTDEKLNEKQIRFVKLIVDYVIKKGVMDKRVLQDYPFDRDGSIVELFKDDMGTARKIISVIDEINENAQAM